MEGDQQGTFHSAKIQTYEATSC